MFVTERIKQYIDYKGISKYKFHKDLGLSNGFLDKDRAIGTDKCAKILEHYPEINPEWLLTGKGKMLKSLPDDVGNVAPDADRELRQEFLLTGEGKPHYDIDLKKSHTKIEVEAVEFYLSKVPLLPVKAVSKMTMGMSEIDLRDVQNYYVIPEFENAHFMITVNGEAMQPTYRSGDIIACYVLENTNLVRWGRVYVVHHKGHGTIVRRLFPADAGYIECKADNADYPAFKIDTNNITNFSLVIGSIRPE